MLVFANLPYEYHPKKYKWFSTFFLHLNRGPTGVNFSRQIGYDTVFGSQGVKMGIGGKQRIRWKRRQIGTLNLMNIFLEIESAIAVHDPGLNLWPCMILASISRRAWSWPQSLAMSRFENGIESAHSVILVLRFGLDQFMLLTVFPSTQTKQ